MATRERKSFGVAAIYFGTAYLGYAYTYRWDYEKDHTKVTYDECIP